MIICSLILSHLNIDGMTRLLLKQRGKKLPFCVSVRQSDRRSITPSQKHVSGASYSRTRISEISWFVFGFMPFPNSLRLKAEFGPEAKSKGTSLVHVQIDLEPLIERIWLRKSQSIFNEYHSSMSLSAIFIICAFFYHECVTFLDASSHLYMRVCPSVRPWVRPFALRKKRRGRTHPMDNKRSAQ